MMDFGLIGMEGLVGSQQESGSPDPDGKRKCTGSGFVKQERSGSPPPPPDEEDPSSRAPKMPRNCHDLGLSIQQQQELMLMRSGDCRPPPQSQMLSFASPTSDVSFLTTNKDDKPSQSLPLSYYHHSPAPVYSRNAGYGSGSMHGSLSGIRGPFTPAQWIELEHQALIYKYLTANVPVPATLLIPIRKALNPSGFSGFSTGSFPAHSYGWGPFHLGYSGSTDPEPGRCRRTDGKKWRCSRDAVPDQKYCERHINRGRHRSRKPVEGQTGQAASGPTNNPIPKVGPTSSATSSAVASSAGSVSNSLAIASHQLKSLQAGAPDPVNRHQDPQGLSMMPKDSPFSIPEQHNPYKSTQPEFGFVSTDALLNPLPKNPYLNCTKNYNNSFLDFNNEYHQTQEQQSNRSVNPWSEELNSDWTQLSMSIPMSELSSSSPNQEKLSAPSPPRLSHENALNETGTKNGNWIPVSWGNSMGGPLGEVLNSTGNGSPPQMESSPTGVLQKGAFVSPPDENRKTTQEAAARLGDELLGSAHVASSIPAL